MNLATYLANLDHDELTAETVRQDWVYAYGEDERDALNRWTVYDCLVFETNHAGKKFVLTAGSWFEIAATFAQQILRQVEQIARPNLALPQVRQNQDGSLESETLYNERVADQDRSVALLDRQIARCQGASTGIEVCDLLTEDKDLIHVKHREGGSSSLSHLFAQGRMSAEALLRDRDFRQDARRFLQHIRPGLQTRIPVAKPDPRRYRVVFGILGTEADRPGEDLPFFSQLNLARTSQALSELGYKIGIVGIPVQ